MISHSDAGLTRFDVVDGFRQSKLLAGKSFEEINLENKVRSGESTGKILHVLELLSAFGLIIFESSQSKVVTVKCSELGDQIHKHDPYFSDPVTNLIFWSNYLESEVKNESAMLVEQLFNPGLNVELNEAVLKQRMSWKSSKKKHKTWLFCVLNLLTELEIIRKEKETDTFMYQTLDKAKMTKSIKVCFEYKLVSYLQKQSGRKASVKNFCSNSRLLQILNITKLALHDWLDNLEQSEHAFFTIERQFANDELLLKDGSAKELLGAYFKKVEQDAN